jgi:hypothetical protein
MKKYKRYFSEVKTDKEKYKKLYEKDNFNIFISKIEKLINLWENQNLDSSYIYEKVIEYIESNKNYAIWYESDFWNTDYFKDLLFNLEEKYDFYIDRFSQQEYIDDLINTYKKNTKNVYDDIYVLNSLEINKIEKGYALIAKEQKKFDAIYQKNINTFINLFKTLEKIIQVRNKNEFHDDILCSSYFAKNTDSVYFSIKDYYNKDRSIILRYSNHYPNIDNYLEDKNDFGKVILVLEPFPDRKTNTYRLPIFKKNEGIDELFNFLENEWIDFFTKDEIKKLKQKIR